MRIVSGKGLCVYFVCKFRVVWGGGVYSKGVMWYLQNPMNRL